MRTISLLQLLGHKDCQKIVLYSTILWTTLKWLFELLLKSFTVEDRLKRTLFNWAKQDKTCTFSRKSSFSNYIQQKNRKANNTLRLYQLDAGRLTEGKGHETDVTCKRGLPQKLACFVLLCPIKKCSISCMFWIFFSECWQSTLLRFFLFFYS